VIGNPPWEVLRHDQASTVSFLRQSGHYPSCDRGHLNLYQPFLERALDLVRPGGRVGLVLPWGLATDEGAMQLRRRLFTSGAVDTIVGIENSAGLFPIHRGLRFMALVASPGSRPVDTHARFGVRSSNEIDDMPADAGDAAADEQCSRLSAAAIHAIGGASLRIPDARRPGDVDWLLQVSRAFPRLGSADGWHLQFGRELNATDDRGSFGDTGLPVLDGKHIAPFAVSIDRSIRRIDPGEALRLLPDRRFTHARLAYRDVSAATNRFALIAAIIPPNVVTTHTLFCLRNRITHAQQDFLCALFNSTALNSIVRMLMGGHVTTSLIEALPVPGWDGSQHQLRIAALGRRLLESPLDLAAKEELDAEAGRLYGLR
jgi:hypothetical protein